MWTQLKLKADEAEYFCKQMNAHEKHPRLFLFYLSAFITSSRSITFHLQKQFKHIDIDKTYETLRDELLNNKMCGFFIDLRNHIEKEGYPPILVNFLVARKEKHTGNLFWTTLASGNLFSGQEDQGMVFLDNLIKKEWDLGSMSGIPAQIKYVYNFVGYPDDCPERRTSVVDACQELIDTLWYFIAQFRDEWESKNDKNALDKKLEKWMSGIQ